MSRDDILRMAREAGMADAICESLLSVLLLERFAALVEAAEREACAKIAEAVPWQDGGRIPSNAAIASAIRVRGAP